MRLRLLGAFVALALACQPATPPAGIPTPPPGPIGMEQPSPEPTPTAAPSPTPSPTLAPSTATCGQVITRDFVLGNDLECPKDGLIVGANGITVDLGGRALKGPGMGGQTWPNPNLTSVGVKVEGRKNVTVKNGQVSAFATNVFVNNSSEVVLEGIESRRSRYGVYLLSTHRSIVRKSTTDANIYGLHLQRSNENQILDNQLVRQTYNSPGGYGLYAFASRGNRVIGNTIEGNLNWGIWLSDAREHVFFHNNVVGNSPQVSDNTGANTWHDPDKKEGNWWGDYGGLDRNGDGIGDSPYQIGGPGNQVDAYPFVERSGWKKKTSATIDTYVPPPPKPRRDVRLLAVTGGTLAAASPSDARMTPIALGPVSSVALAPDERTLYTLVSDERLLVFDTVTGRLAFAQFDARPGVLVANRDGKQAIVVGSDGALAIDVKRGTERRLNYVGEPRDAVASWKHNLLFVSTPRGLDVFYLGRSGGEHAYLGQIRPLFGSVPYTIPLGGPGGVLTMNRSGTRIYVVAQGARTIDVVDTEQYAVIDRIPVPWEGRALAVSPDETTVYLAATEGVLAIDLSDKGQRGSAYFLGYPVDVAVSPNGDEVYVALDGFERGIAVLSAAGLRTRGFVRAEGAVSRLLVASY